MKFLELLRSFDGIWYYITAILCIVFIMAIIGYLMERELKKKEDLALKVPTKKEEEHSKTIEQKENSTTNTKVTPSTSRPIIDFSAPASMEPQAEEMIDPIIEDVYNSPVIPTIVAQETETLEEIPPMAEKQQEPFILELNSSEFDIPSNLETKNKQEK